MSSGTKLLAIATALAVASCGLAVVLESGSWARGAGADEVYAGHPGEAAGECPEPDACQEPGSTISALAAI